MLGRRLSGKIEDKTTVVCHGILCECHALTGEIVPRIVSVRYAVLPYLSSRSSTL